MTTETNVAAGNSLERRIDITVVLADIESDVDSRLKKLAQTVKMNGFRKGKVPMKIVAQGYGDQARSEAIGAAVQKSFSTQAREQNLHVAGYPNFEPKEGVDSGKLEFSAVFEVYPEIKLADLSGKEVERLDFKVSEADVDKTLEALRKQHVKYVPTDRAAADGDRVTIDFLGRKDGVEFDGGKASDFPLLLGQGRMLPDFEAAVRGMTTGSSKTFDMTFPEDYQAAELAGKPVSFEVTVKSVEEGVLPQVDADFARSMGIADGDLSKMRQEVEANLLRETKKRLSSRRKEIVMDFLLENNPLDVPKALVDAECAQMMQATAKDLESRGNIPKGFQMLPDWFVTPATRRVKLGLILAEVVKEHKLEAKPEQVRTVIEDFAASFEDPQQVVHWYYSQPQRLAEAEALALEENVVAWVFASAKPQDKTLALEELMGTAA